MRKDAGEVAAAQAAPSFGSRRRFAGTRLGKYDVGPRIGAGGSAAVYLGRLMGPLGPERVVALKVVHDHLSEEGDFISQFLDEANLLVRLTHPNIVRVHELGSDTDTLFLAMEYLHGQPLQRLVSALARRSQRIPPLLVAWIGARVADALGFAHDLKDAQGRPLGLVHRDVSPQNVFICYDGEVKLIDFGIARAARRIAQTTVGHVKGKFSYMAPEQIMGRAFDHRVDLFALGATLYEAFTGTRLFAGVDADDTIFKVLTKEVPDLREKVPGFPGALAEIIARSLAPDPEDRYPSGKAMAEALDAFVRASSSGEPTAELGELVSKACEDDRLEMQRTLDQMLVDPVQRTVDTIPATHGESTLPAPARPRRRWAALALAVLVVLGGGAFLLGTRTDRESTPSTAASVTLEVTTVPDVQAQITVEGVALEGRPARLVRPRGSGPVAVVAKAPGYEVATISVVPDRDRSVSIALLKSAPAAPSVAPSASGGTLPPTSPAATLARPPTQPSSRTPAASATPPAVTPPTAAPTPTTAPPTHSAPLHL